MVIYLENMDLELRNLNAMINISYRTQTTALLDIYNFLIACDSDFTPKLSSEINLYKFSEKIHKNAVRFEAYSDDKLIGLLCVYLNDKESNVGFINHISILQKYKGNGISSILIKNCLEYAKSKQFKYIRLEVSKNNTIAKKLYEKYTFLIEKDNLHKLEMIKNLNVEKLDATRL